jgi:putative glycerol-1-phosphate prenyltransferase
MIKKVRSVVKTPIIVGGGIKDVSTAEKAFSAGADLIVVGNSLEKDPSRAFEIAEAALKF